MNVSCNFEKTGYLDLTTLVLLCIALSLIGEEFSVYCISMWLIEISLCYF